MEPPKAFKIKRNHGYSICTGCGDWKETIPFRHEGVWWSLCKLCWVDYWFNTEELADDFII